MSKGIAVALAATIGAGALMTGPFMITPAQAGPEMVAVHNQQYSPGTIVVKTGERRLYYILDADHAMRYPVGVGKAGKQWRARRRSTASIATRPGRHPRK